jgi:hypothetical protein
VRVSAPAWDVEQLRAKALKYQKAAILYRENYYSAKAELAVARTELSTLESSRTALAGSLLAAGGAGGSGAGAASGCGC